MHKRLNHNNLRASKKNGASTTTGSKSSTACSKIGTNITENITENITGNKIGNKNTSNNNTENTIGSKSITTAGENTGGTSTDRQAYCFLEGWWEKERRGPSASSQ